MFSIDKAKLERGLHRLLEGPEDLRPSVVAGSPSRSEAEQTHGELFGSYIHDVHVESIDAAERWEKQMALAIEETGSTKTAKHVMWQQSPAGPAARATFVAVVREYWLACDAVNRTLPRDRRVAPQVFMLGWLLDALGRKDPAVQVLACMPYWPIGMDAGGQWV